MEDFLKILREVDKTLAGNLEESFPSLKIQTKWAESSFCQEMDSLTVEIDSLTVEIDK